MRKRTRKPSLLRDARTALLEHRVVWALLVVAVCLGGGGRGANIANLFVQMAALLVVAVDHQRIRAGWERIGWPAKVLVVATLALPLLQLVPLPPSVWTLLPGREILVEAQQVAVGELRWAPISLVPLITLLALTGLFAPLVVFLASANLDRRAGVHALAVVAALGLVCAGLGALQLLAGGSLTLFDTGDPGYLHGLFANHNSTGIFLVIALCATIEFAAVVRLKGAPLAVAAACGIGLAVAVLLTQSRSSMALMIFPLGLLAFHVVQRSRFAGNRLLAAGAIGAIVLAGTGISALAVTSNERLAQTVERFDTTANLRPALWSDARNSAERFFPVGSGMGTFDEVFQLDESLETLYPARAGRAHSDYLEIAIEAGVAGILVLFSWAVYAGWGSYRAAGRQSLSWPFYLAVTGSFAAQSLLDYPLRNQALLCVAALILGLMAGSWKNERTRVKEMPSA